MNCPTPVEAQAHLEALENFKSNTMPRMKKIQDFWNNTIQATVRFRERVEEAKKKNDTLVANTLKEIEQKKIDDIHHTIDTL